MSQPYDRIFNFSAGPSILPVPVLERARDELTNYCGTGMSVMEMSHRSKAFEAIIGKAESDFRTLLGVPEDYRVLFLQGGASLQFTMTALNLLPPGGKAQFVVTGSWGKKAVESAALVGNTEVIWDGKSDNYRDVPDLETLPVDAGAAFVHLTSNETIQGVEFPSDVAMGAPVVCDMSSDILSRPVDVAKYDLIYAGAQKNMGPAGVTVVIVSDAALEKCAKGLAPMLDYRLQSDNASLYNTPPCWSIYVCGLVYEHLMGTGGLEGAKTRNDAKAKVLYDAIDGSGGFFSGHARPGARSRMNVTFTLPSDELTSAFVKGADALGLDGLKGHRSVGGCRASIYNAFPHEGCVALAEYMAEFVRKQG